jgi:hypothetical protein
MIITDETAAKAVINGRKPQPHLAVDNESAIIEPIKTLGEWDAGDDTGLPAPREWLLGNVFARKFMSSLLAEGGVGKTALRYAQLLSLATERQFTGEYVFQRCRVLIVSLEDDAEELKRRILAAMLHHKVVRSELKGWLFLAAPGGTCGKLMTTDPKGNTTIGPLAAHIEKVIRERNRHRQHRSVREVAQGRGEQQRRHRRGYSGARRPERQIQLCYRHAAPHVKGHSRPRQRQLRSPTLHGHARRRRS